MSVHMVQEWGHFGVQIPSLYNKVNKISFLIQDTYIHAHKIKEQFLIGI